MTTQNSVQETASAGARLVTDAGGTAAAGVATLSDDGKTLVFETTVTGFVLEYYAKPAVDMTTAFEPVSGH